ncbi:2-hydroxyacid dehydrogenase [Rhodoferax sp. WC2427]|uniref:2-hydroxyacid dehydrogenase n=1 Tax=Rhodoferax sp. WC2427 TaxID=3234144 RepID=UPI0034658E57
MSVPRPQVLVLNFMAPHHQALLAPYFEVIYAPTDALRAAHIAADAATIRAVLTIGSVGLTATEMDALPALELVCALGVGFENIAIAHARARGLALANGAGTNDDCVADHAFALLLAVVRNVPKLDAQCRQGLWRDVLPLPASVSQRRMGIVGLGGIGHKVAQRALGFGMQIGYHGRTPQPQVAHTYFADLVALAAWADFLVVATPGGPATRHLVGAEVLAALGADGYLVNVSRGSVVDTAALAAALRAGQLAGAGLDVYESEPQPPAELLDLDTVVLTPHVGGWSPQAIEASVQRFIENATRHFAGLAVVSPI